MFLLIVFVPLTSDGFASPLHECPNLDPFFPQKLRTSLRVAHWNAEWLWRPNTRYEEWEPQVKCPGECAWESEDALARHLMRVAKVLEDVDADIFSLNEVQDCSVISDPENGIFKHLASSAYSVQHVWSRDLYTGQQIAFMSKLPLSLPPYRLDQKVSVPVPESTCPPSENEPKEPSRESHPMDSEEQVERVGASAQAGPLLPSSAQLEGGGRQSDDSYGPSKNLVAVYRVEGLPRPEVAVIGAHFLSGAMDVECCPWREAQGKVIGEEVKRQIAAGRHVMVVGDLNDFDPEVSASSSQPISNAVNLAKAGILTNVATFIEKDNVFSEGESYSHNLIDHIAVDPELAGRVQNVQILHHLPCGWHEDRISDHFPMFVDIHLD